MAAGALSVIIVMSRAVTIVDRIQTRNHTRETLSTQDKTLQEAGVTRDLTIATLPTDWYRMICHTSQVKAIRISFKIRRDKIQANLKSWMMKSIKLQARMKRTRLTILSIWMILSRLRALDQMWSMSMSRVEALWKTKIVKKLKKSKNKSKNQRRPKRMMMGLRLSSFS